MSTAELAPIADIEHLAQMLSKSTLLPVALKGSVADIAVTILAGRELGLGPMTALRTIHVVEGRPVLSADVMVALVQGSGKAESFHCVESTSTTATYETHRLGAPEPQRMTFTIEQARKAGLIKPKGAWETYPDAMLRARAKSALARDVYGDVLAGCYTDEEAAEFRRDDRPAATFRMEGNTFVAPEPPQLAAPESPDMLSAFLSAPSMDELNVLAIQAKGITGTEREKLLEAYAKRKAELA
jgi:hypothetical protein